MRTKLDLETLKVETTEMHPVYGGPAEFETLEGYPGPDGIAASIVVNTLTRPISADTRSSPCIA
ncbi:MAG TPA: hypothetical protein VFQ39_02410 [Longimicrobium sp.]|nr:hypothetical protein [Longimicrobium sp.]